MGHLDAPAAKAGTLYGDQFYRDQLDESYRSARLYAAHLAEVYRPASVVDFGCGRGPWLKAFGELGAKRLVGYDGPWNSQEEMVDPGIEFHPKDLNKAVTEGLTDERFELAMTLEVVEHLAPGVSKEAVATLCKLADVVMFGAAFTAQPGTDHINLRPHSFWGELFASEGYRCYDYFRPVMWGRGDVPYWYQQNTFLYVKEGHALEAKLAAKGCAPLARLELLDFVHPELLQIYVSRMPGEPALKRWARAVMPAPMFAAAKRMKVMMTG